MLEFLMPFLPGLVGTGFWWFSGKCRGRNAKTAFQFAAWGFWLWYLTIFAGPVAALIPLMPVFLAKLLLLTPSVLCFFLAVSAILKEMRSQQRGDYTDAA